MATFSAPDAVQRPPYIEKDVLRERFVAKTRPRGEGCLEWTGCKCARLKNRPDEGQIRVRVACKDYRVLSASRVAWYLAGNDWPEPGAQLRHTCGHRDCVAVAHLTLVTLAQRTKLTDELRREIKRLYGLRVAVMREVYGRLGVTRQPSGISVTAKRAWVSRSTIERFLQGHRMSPAHWMTQELDADGLRQVYELAERDVDSIKAKLAAVEAYSIKNLASRYGVAMSLVTRALYD